MFLRMQFRARRQSYAAAFADAAPAILLAGEQAAGTATVWRGPAEFRLVDIAFLPEYRNRGLGARWISGLIEEAGAAALPLRLSVLLGNPAIRLYQRLGFVATVSGSMYIEMEHKDAAANQPAIP
jgi:ribosomal protein S18 acetylase RimI-like enzyme